jgi:hypothetical protein
MSAISRKEPLDARVVVVRRLLAAVTLLNELLDARLDVVRSGVRFHVYTMAPRLAGSSTSRVPVLVVALSENLDTEAVVADGALTTTFRFVWHSTFTGQALPAGTRARGPAAVPLHPPRHIRAEVDGGRLGPECISARQAAYDLQELNRSPKAGLTTR